MFNLDDFKTELKFKNKKFTINAMIKIMTDLKWVLDRILEFSIRIFAINAVENHLESKKWNSKIAYIFTTAKSAKKAISLLQESGWKLAA